MLTLHLMERFFSVWSLLSPNTERCSWCDYSMCEICVFKYFCKKNDNKSTLRLLFDKLKSVTNQIYLGQINDKFLTNMVVKVCHDKLWFVATNQNLSVLSPSIRQTKICRIDKLLINRNC